jgi:serine/threonine-protein kinase
MTDALARLTTALADRYAIERELGQGGMATVYLAEDLKHGRKVALKVLKPELAAVLGAERFVQEIKTTAKLQHPHILSLFDSGTAEGFLFYVMPYIQGETLRDKLDRETQLGVDEAVRLAREVADALDYAHRSGVIHRDIKPENILLHDGRPMLADFGIALAVSAAAGGRMTETGLSLGTPYYMSPEQATAEKEITARSDIYSIGSVLFEMLTGNPPYMGASAQQIIMKIITEPAALVTALRKSVPPNVAAAVAKSLEKLPADRFESAKAFADALGNPEYTNATFMAAAPPPAPARGRRLSIAAGFALTIAVTAAATWWMSTRRVSDSVAVHLAFAVTPSQPLSGTVGRNVVLSPDGRLVVYSTADSAGQVRLFARTIDDLRQQPIAGTERALYPFFSPDGRWIGFYDGRQLKKVPTEGGTSTPLAEIGALSGASWAADGIVISDGGRLALVPSEGGAPAPLARGDSSRGYWPVVLPGGKSAAFATASATTDARVAVLDLRTGRRTNLGIHGLPVGVVGGELVVMRGDGALMAAAFDARAPRVTGNERVVVDETQRANNSQVKAAVSASGSLAYVSGSNLRQTVLVDLHGAARPLPIPPSQLNFPRFSPDGRQLLADVLSGARTDVWIYDVASGAGRRVTTEGTTNNRAVWSPDGTRILFRTDRRGPNQTLWWQSADGSGGAGELVGSPANDVFQGLLTPDRHTVIYRTGSLQGSDIWYRNLAGDTAAKAFAKTPFGEFAPSLSPDGRWLAYELDEMGSQEVIVRPFPGPGAQYAVSVGGGLTPVWSRDGRRIFYTFGSRVYEATVVTSPIFAVTARRMLFEGPYFLSPGHASFDVSPDGASFVMVRPVAGSGEQIVVIHNWQAELRSRTREAIPR